ncbi:MAG: Crp/Fnr family transcriptional regulator [Gaiellales bacterium]
MRFELLAAVPEEDLRRALSIARRRTFAKGEVVFHRGDPANALHLITKGRFAARATTPLGDTVLFRVMGSGDAFGELALLTADGIRSATVAALEPSQTLSIARADFEVLVAEHPDVRIVLTELLAASVRRLSERLLEALHVGAERRVLRRLLELADEEAEPVVLLTQDELAGLAGTSRETVNRVLGEERRRGTVEVHRGRIVLLAASELGRRAGLSL